MHYKTIGVNHLQIKLIYRLKEELPNRFQPSVAADQLQLENDLVQRMPDVRLYESNNGLFTTINDQAVKVIEKSGRLRRKTEKKQLNFSDAEKNLLIEPVRKKSD